MKKIIFKMSQGRKANHRESINHASSQRGSLFIVVLIACFGLTSAAQAVVPAPDGCYPNYTTAEGCNALNFLTTGAGNTGVGWYSLFSNTDASFNTGVGGGALALNNADSNTAVGAAALLLNTTGDQNTAVGTDALVYNDIGFENTAVGAFALFGNTIGTQNTAIGDGALLSNTTAFDNTACGLLALRDNVDGLSNTAVGAAALLTNVSGDDNQAFGRGALRFTTGSGNIGIGREAGVNETTADHIICIGSPGDLTNPTASNRCFIGSIRGVSTGNANAIPVLIDSDGQLGTVSSSRRFKKDIEPMAQTSEAILALKPVTFHYKDRDTKEAENTPQFGLIAEDVEQVNRDLVVYGEGGKIWSVRYDAVNAMLLNEFLKEHKRVQKLEATLAQQRKGFESKFAEQQMQIEALTAGLQKVSAQIEMRKPAAKVVVNKP